MKPIHKKRSNKNIFLVIGLLFIIGICCLGFYFFKKSQKLENSGGVSVSQDIHEATQREIQVTLPEKITLPLTIQGNVVGNWFFEGSFPVYLLDNTEQVIAVGLAKSPESTMTDSWVTFHVTLPTFSYHGKGTILFKKDNPSGEISLDGGYRVPVVIE